VSRLSKSEELISAILQPGGSIVASIAATQCDPPTAKSGKVTGCLAITNQRVVFAGKAITKSINRTIPLAQVSSLELSKGMMLSHIQLTLSRTVALVPGAVDALARFHDRHDALRTRLGGWAHDQVLITYDGAPVRPAALTRYWHKVTQAAGLRRIRLHDARHTHTAPCWLTLVCQYMQLVPAWAMRASRPLCSSTCTQVRLQTVVLR